MSKRPYKKDSVFKTPWFELISKTFEGEEAPHYALEVSDYVCVIAESVDEKIILVQQYRPAIDDLSLEFPSGHVDPGENALEAGQRELKEETGYEGGQWHHLPTLKSDVGRINNHSWTYFAKGVQRMESFSGEEGIEVLEVEKKNLKETIFSEAFRHSLHVCSYFLAKDKKYI